MSPEKQQPAWEVKITEEAGKTVERSRALTEFDRQVIVDWAKTVRKHGPDALRAEGVRSKWNDHDLSGAWAGYRASSFSSAGRILYKVIGRLVCVAVVRVTTTHDYGDPSREELREIERLEKQAKESKPKEVK